MSMGLVVLIIWLLSIIEYHNVNIPNSNSLFTQKPKNSGLRRSVSRCNRSVDQPGLEPGTSRL